MTIEKAIGQLEEVVMRNIANHLIQIEFHAHATDDELRQYYRGGVSREALVRDSIERLDGEILLHSFIKKNKKKIIKKYGDKKPDHRLASAVQRELRDVSQKRGRVGNTQEVTSGLPTQGRTGGPDHGTAVHESTEGGSDSANGREGGGDPKKADRSTKRANKA